MNPPATLWTPPPVASVAVRGLRERAPVARLFFVGRNYHAHAVEMGRPVDKSAELPFYFTKSPSTLVESGATVVGQAGETMRQIVTNAGNVKQLIAEISHGAQEQTAGLTDITQSVEQLDGMTQQNAALVEQTAAAAASLKDSALRMNEAMAFFRTR